VVKKEPLLGETEGFVGVRLKDHLGLVVRTPMSLNEGPRSSGIPTLNSPREDSIMSVPNLISHRCITSGSVEAEPLEIKRVPVLMGLILSKVEALKTLEKH
jgi:hypothetical protein